MKVPGSLAVFALLPFLAGCTTAADFTQRYGRIFEETENLSVVLVDPCVADLPFDRGCRFIQGGWIKKIAVKKDGWDWTPLMKSSVFDYHAAFGVPEEIVPSIRLSGLGENKSLQLKVGVGMVMRHGDNVFGDTPVAYFPWTMESGRDNRGRPQITFRQEFHSRTHGYVFSKSLLFEGDGMIRMDCTLNWKGSRSLSFESYLHPFIRLDDAPQYYRYSLTENISSPEKWNPIPVSSKQPSVDLESGFPAGKWIAINNEKNSNRVIAVRCSRPIKKIRFWFDNDCFSVEPFVAFSVTPESSVHWSWTLLAR